MGRAADIRGVVVVGGATGALGRVIVARLTAAGWPVIGVARTEAALDELTRSCSGFTPLVADVATDVPAFDRPVAAIVHAAGAPLAGGILEVAPESVLAGVEVKVNGLLRLIRSADSAFLPGARIIAVGGALGFDPTPGAAVPGVSNAALANTIRQLSAAYGPRGITAHLIAAGPVDTPRLRSRAADEARLAGVPEAEVIAAYAASSPLARLTRAEEIAWIVETLLAPEATALAGSTLFLDSGSRTAIP